MKNIIKLPAFVTIGFIALSLVSTVAQVASSPKMPTFFARRDYPGLFSTSMQVADTNGDGIPDLIANQTGFIEVQLGNGDGTFRPGPTSLTAADGAFSFAAVDLNGDGKIDLAQANQSSVVVCMGNGDGTFQSGVTYPIGDVNIGHLVLGDFNGDRIPDIATTGNNGVWLLTGKGDGTFNPAVLAVTLPSALNLTAADFNGDGKLDLAVIRVLSGTAGNFAVLLGNGDGTFQPPQTFTNPVRPLGIAAGSLVKGWPPGIVVNSSYSGYVYLYFGNGKGGFSGPRLVNLPGTQCCGIAIGDINGDGQPDLVSESGNVAYGEGGGYFTKPIGYPINAADEISNVVLADLRNVGKTDIVTGGYAAISVLLNEGKGLMEDGIWTSVTGGAGCGAKADFNGDGKPDLAVNTPSGVSILLGTGKYAAPFKAGTNIALAGAECLVTGDINGDGKPDLLVPLNGTVVAYLGNGDGTFTLQSTTVTPSGGYLAVGDFNHDGKLDFATSGNLIALGNGDGTFQAPTAIVTNPPTGGFSGIAVGDINNDGWPDLVLTNNAFGSGANATVLLNNQKGGFTQVPTNFGGLTIEPILADLNGDGNLDLVLRATAGGGAWIYLGDGKGGFSLQETLPSPLIDTAGPTFVADVNGDGIPDIGVLAADTLEIFLGQGGATYAAPFSIGTGPSPGSILVANLHGQLPHWGIPDIIVPDTTGGILTLFNLTQ